MLQVGSDMQHGWQLHSNPCLFREAKLKAVFKEGGLPGQVFWEQVLLGNPNSALIWVTFSARLPTQKLQPM